MHASLPHHHPLPPLLPVHWPPNLQQSHHLLDQLNQVSLHLLLLKNQSTGATRLSQLYYVKHRQGCVLRKQRLKPKTGLQNFIVREGICLARSPFKMICMDIPGNIIILWDIHRGYYIADQRYKNYVTLPWAQEAFFFPIS